MAENSIRSKRAPVKHLSQEYLKSVLDYNPETGIFVWKERPLFHFPDMRVMKSWNTQNCGKVAGTIDDKGYIRIGINKIPMFAHRLAVIWMTGEFHEQVDHCDTIKSNNKWNNLRPTIDAHNQRNKPISKRNTSGIKGVHFIKTTGKWSATIGVGSTKKFLGNYWSKEEAARAYEEGSKKYHGEFGRIK